jgi:hypothetical protein
MRRDIPHPPSKTYGKLQTVSLLSPYRAVVVQFRPEMEVAEINTAPGVRLRTSQNDFRRSSGRSGVTGLYPG